MPGHALADQAASGELPDVIGSLVSAGWSVLIDAEVVSAVARVAGADHVLVEVAADRDLAALHQRFVITSVHADAPGLVLPELDPRGAGRVDGMLGVVAAWLSGGAPFAEDHRLVALEPDHNSQIVPLVRRVVVNRAVLVEPLDIDDVDLAGMRVDDVSLAPHRGDDCGGEVEWALGWVTTVR